MSIANVALSNTFNELRTTTNTVITEVNKLSDGTAVLVVDSITANTFTGVSSDLNISANTGTDVVSLVTESLRIVGTNGISTSIASSSNTINVNLDTSGITAGAYGSASKVPQLVIDAQGRVTSASNVNVAGVSAFNYHSGNANFQIATADGGSFTASIGQHLGTSANVTFQQLTVSGNLTVTGTTTTISANNLAVKDNLIYLNNESSNTNVDLGFAGNYNDGVYRHAGLFRDADDGIWKFFDSYTPEPDASANLNTSNASFQLAKVSAGSIVATGNSVITVADNTNAALRITQTGTGNALLVEDSANPDSTPFVVTASGLVGIGTTSPATGFNYDAPSGDAYMLVRGDTAARIHIRRAGNDANAPAFELYKARGTYTSPTIVSSGDRTADIRFQGYDGTQYLATSSIFSEVDGTPGTNDMPGRLIFSTTADGASSPTERMRIDSAGNVGIGGAPLAGSTLVSYKAMTGGSGYVYGFNNVATVNSDATAEAVSFQSFLSTQAASFTAANLRHFKAYQSTIGAGSTVTNQVGYFADASLTGATNNYGFYSNIASGTGRYNFYANGTADNYFNGNVGIGGTPIAGFKVSNYGNLSGATTAYSYYSGSTFQSDVTTNGIGFGTFLGTQAASFTLTSLTHFRTAQGTFGAGSTVTNQFGFEATNTLTGATNNYGFYSNIASGTGRWNFYAAGTAQNYFAGNTLIGSTSSSPVGKLTVLSDRASISYNTVFSTYNGASFENDFILGFNGTVTNVGNYQNFPIAFIANNSEGLRITGSGTISLGAAPGSESLRVTRVASAVNYLEAQGQITTGGPSLIAAGSDTNIDLLFKSKGTGAINSYTNSTVLQFQVAHTASAVNYIQATGAGTGALPGFFALGSDTNVSIGYRTKGTGSHVFYSDGGSNPQFSISRTGSSVNYIQATGAITGSTPTFSAIGSDTNISLNFAPKGNGGVSITESTGAQSISKVLTVQSGSYGVWVNPRFSALAYNPLTAANTTGLIFSASQSGNGIFLLAPWSDVAAGIRISQSNHTANTTIASNTLFLAADTTIDGPARLKYFDEPVTALTLSGGNTAVDWNLGAVWNITLTANSTIYFTNPPSSNRARTVTLFITNSGASQKSLTVTGARYTDGVVPVLSSAASAVDAISFTTIDGGLNYYGSFILAALA